VRLASGACERKAGQDHAQREGRDRRDEDPNRGGVETSREDVWRSSRRSGRSRGVCCAAIVLPRGEPRSPAIDLIFGAASRYRSAAACACVRRARRRTAGSPSGMAVGVGRRILPEALGCFHSGREHGFPHWATNFSVVQPGVHGVARDPGCREKAVASTTTDGGTRPAQGPQGNVILVRSCDHSVTEREPRRLYPGRPRPRACRGAKVTAQSGVGTRVPSPRHTKLRDVPDLGAFSVGMSGRPS